MNAWVKNFYHFTIVNSSSIRYDCFDIYYLCMYTVHVDLNSCHFGVLGICYQRSLSVTVPWHPAGTSVNVHFCCETRTFLSHCSMLFGHLLDYFVCKPLNSLCSDVSYFQDVSFRSYNRDLAASLNPDISLVPSLNLTRLFQSDFMTISLHISQFSKPSCCWGYCFLGMQQRILISFSPGIIDEFKELTAAFWWLKHKFHFLVMVTLVM